MKTLTMKKTTNSGYQVVLKQDVDTEYESILEVEFFDTKRKAVNFAKKLSNGTINDLSVDFLRIYLS